jgi:hypothetical protein
MNRHRHCLPPGLGPLLRTSCGGYNIMARLNIEEEP